MLLILSWAVLSASFVVCAFAIWAISLTPQRFLLFENLLFSSGLAVAVGWFFGFATWPLADLTTLAWIHLAPLACCLPLLVRCAWIRRRYRGQQLCSGCGEPQVLRVMYRTDEGVCKECGCRRTFPAEQAMWGRDDQSRRAIELVGSRKRVVLSSIAVLVSLGLGIFGARWSTLTIPDVDQAALASRSVWTAGVVLAAALAFAIREQGSRDPQ